MCTISGGIATFILDINWRIRGGAVMLPVDLGGYSVSPLLQNDPGFAADLTEKAKKGRRLENCFSIFGYLEFTMFDLIINGITGVYTCSKGSRSR